jgi:enoyl-CoA hydratase
VVTVPTDGLKYETLALEQPAARVLLVRMNRPERRNAISTQLGHNMRDVFARLTADTQDYRCVILTGAGTAFGAGADLKERNGMSNAAWLAQHAVFERMTLALLDCPIPVIAAVNGAAYAGSCELALTCDFIYASETARFALTEITLGIMPGGGGTQLLPRAAGARRAKEVILTGKPFSAQDALAWGIVNKLCAPEALMDETLATATIIAGNAPISVRQAKRAMHFGAHMDLRSALFLEVDCYNKMVGTEDRLEGVRAFNEKRRPDFKGR